MLPLPLVTRTNNVGGGKVQKVTAYKNHVDIIVVFWRWVTVYMDTKSAGIIDDVCIMSAASCDLVSSLFVALCSCCAAVCCAVIDRSLLQPTLDNISLIRRTVYYIIVVFYMLLSYSFREKFPVKHLKRICFTCVFCLSYIFFCFSCIFVIFIVVSFWTALHTNGQIWLPVTVFYL